MPHRADLSAIPSRPMATALKERTPQRLGNHAVMLGRRRRARAVTRQVAAHTAALSAHLLAGNPEPLAANVLASARTQLGLRYAISSCRCSPQPCWARDCSGLICMGLNANGYPSICTSSFGFAHLARDHGTIISKAQALWTPGAIGIRCPFCDPNFNGSNGHIWFCKGDGHSSVEEGGHATGCYEGSADKPGDVIYALIPGVNYGPPPPPPAPPRRSERMAVQQPKKTPIGGAVAFACLSPDGGHVECWDGCSIAGDAPHPTIKNLRTWRPADANAPARFTNFGPYALEHRDDNPATDRDESFDGPLGVFVADDRGYSAIGRFSY